VVGDAGSASVSVDVAASTMTEPRNIGFYGPQVLTFSARYKASMSGSTSFAGDHADGNALHVVVPVRV
jgi:hypothetical protein